MEIIRMRLLIMMIIGQLMIVAAESDMKRPKTIAEMQSDYLLSEEKLWQKIDQILGDREHIDEKSLNETMIEAVNAHQNIFYGNTFEDSSYWRSYLLFGIENYRDYLSNVNTSLQEHYWYLFDEDGQVRFKRWNVCIDQTSFHNLTTNRNDLFDLTINRKDSILQHIQTEAKCCVRYVNYVISEAQLVREYYTNVGKAVLRSYAMNQLAHMLMSLIVQENVHAKANDERNLYLDRYGEFERAIESMLSAASLDLWKCNPNPYLDSRTYYTSITNFMQGYIDNEINLNGEQRCDGTCSDFKSTKNYDCQNDTMCVHSNFARTRCTGDIFDCGVIDSDGTACLVKDEWENRRYNYVTFRNGSMNGHNVLCFKAEQTELAKRTERITNECSNCFCYCDEPGHKSDRYFSLRDVTSDIGANKIVTGIAIRKINRVVQFTISERELFPFAKVNDTLKRTQIWKNNSMEFLNDGQNGIDYFTLTRDHRSMNLDTIFLPLNKVVTGVRFQVDDNNRLNIEIRGTDFDYEKGMLMNLEHSTWIKHTDNRINEDREEIFIEEPDSPTRTTNIQERFDSDHKFITFRSADIKKDLAQLTIPFIETVPLEASEPRPLSGVGLYYKGEPGFGGFISIKLISYDRGTI